MGTDRIPYALAIVFHIDNKFLVFTLALFCQFWFEMIETDTGKQCTQPHFFDSIGRSPELMIHIEKRCRPAFYHFETSELRSPINILARQFRFIRPDLLLQPGHQRHVIAKTTEKRHSGMCMRIYETRDQGFTPSVYHLIRLYLKIRPYLPDLLFLYIDISYSTIQ